MPGRTATESLWKGDLTIAEMYWQQPHESMVGMMFNWVCSVGGVADSNEP